MQLHLQYSTLACVGEYSLVNQVAKKKMDREAKERFAQCVKSLRGDRNHRQFAELIGVSRATIQAWEDCRVIPKRESLQTIAELRGESLDEFMGFLQGLPKKDPMDKLITQIGGLSQKQIATLLRAVASRLDPS
ncbi:helix-turn-helix transcriptional regulator [Roseofilum sp. SID3]|uniref:helix-turn-helix transcriptional regulator n=1 Tax=Roseofilum sp. SID3 TaxID=2821499 RepID=UPI00298E58B0|nr:helix-turn-helix transcriptional regulator [Roseofilum sp. SID3]